MGGGGGGGRPAVVGPGAADEPTHHDQRQRQQQPELDHDPAAFGAPAQLAVLVGPGVGALDRPPPTGLARCWHPTSGDLADHAAAGQHLSAGLVVIPGVQMHDWPDRQGTKRDGEGGGGGIQGRCQQPVVAAVGRGRQRCQWHTVRFGGDRAFEALLAAVHRAWPGDLATAGRLGGAAVHRQVLHSRPCMRS
jgi:hypothetical protein